MNAITEVMKKVRKKEWKGMVDACRNSGMTVTDWCTDNGLNPKTYYYRQRKVREWFCENTVQDIVAVPASVTVPASSNEVIKITAGNINIELPQSISADMLHIVMETLTC